MDKSSDTAGVARTKLKSILVSHGGSRDVNAFADAATPVCYLYSEAIQPAALVARCWNLGLTVGSAASARDVHVRVFNEFSEAEIGHVLVPTGIADLDPAVTALLALDAVHAAMTQLGRLRGWGQSPLDAARQHALDRGLIFRTATPWKTSPDRRHRARAVRQIGIGYRGHCQMWIEVERTADGQLVQVSPQLFVLRGLHIGLDPRCLRWNSANVVQLGSVDPLYPNRTITLALGPPGYAVATNSPFRSAPPTPPIARSRPAVLLDPVHQVEIQPVLVFDSDVVPGAYRTHLRDLFEIIKGPEWISWWSAAGRDRLTISWGFGSPRPGFMMTKKGPFGYGLWRPKNEIYVRVWRQDTSTQDADPASLANRDLKALMETIRRRLKLPSHPVLPPPPTK